MAKRPLLRHDWGGTLAAVLFSSTLWVSLAEVSALAEGETVLPPPSAADTKPSGSDSSPKPPETKSADTPLRQSGGANAKPEDGSQAPGKASEPQSASDAKPAEARHAEPKGAEGKTSEPKDAKAEAKQRDTTPKAEGSDELTVRASTVNAVYQISWLGAHIGDFRIHSSVTNRQYSIQANADVSVFFGTVTWQGVTNSRGLMTANGPVPQNYQFRYVANERREAIELRFTQRMVQDIIINPPQHPGARSVPITAAHLQNVVDPLSAVVLLSQARLSRHSGDVCNKRLPVFDGKTRYDLVLSPKGTRAIGATGKLHGTAYVCSVKYVPIAGHRPGKQGENDYATGNTGIEVWLVPLPEAGLLVPYYVHVPTPAGTASMVTSKFDIDIPGGRHAAAD